MISFVGLLPKRRAGDDECGDPITDEAEESLSLYTESTTSTASRQVHRMSSDVGCILASLLSDVDAKKYASIDNIKGKSNGIMNTRPRGPTVPATAKRTASVKNDEGRCTWKDDINRRWRAVNKGRGCKEHTMGRSKGVVKNKLKISDGDSSGVATTADPPTTSTKADTRSYTGINEKVLQDGLTWVSDQGAAQSGRDTNNGAPERDYQSR